MAPLPYAPRLRTPTIRRIIGGQITGLAPRTGMARLTAQPIAGRMLAPSARLAPLPTVRPSRQIIMPTTPIRSSRSGGARPEDKGILGGLLAIPKDVIGFAGNAIKAIPTIVGKGAQSLYGFGETVFDFGADIINPNLYTSRSEVDLAKGRKLGLKGADLLAYATQRTVPLLSPMISSMAKTGARAGEIGTLGFWDTGAPGFDYYQALRQGKLGSMFLEDVGNVMLAGRLAGLGSVGSRLGMAAAEAGAPRFGATVSNIARFADEPIGVMTRGASRLGLKLDEFGRPVLAKLAETPLLNRVVKEPVIGPTRRQALLAAAAESARPLKTLTGGAYDRFKVFAEDKLKALDEKIGTWSREKADLADTGRLTPERAAELDGLINDANKTRSRWQRMAAQTRYARQQVQQGRLEGEVLTTSFTQLFTNFSKEGAVPESPAQLVARANNLREQAANLTDAVARDERLAQADLLERKAAVKAADTTGKLNDTENRNTNWSAAVIVVTKLIDQVMADRAAGLSLEEIARRIQPKELISEAQRLGYGYTPEAIQRAIDFVEGKVDDVDRLEMDTASQLMSTTAGFLENVGTSGEFISGNLSPAQFGDTPVPEIFMAELEKRSFSRRVLRVLDETAAVVVRQLFPELVDTLGKKLDSPEGLFKKLAESRPDSPEYMAAYATLRVTSEYFANPKLSPLADDPNMAMRVAEFFQDPAIYAARMRPMLAYRQSAQMEARAADVNSVLAGLKQLVEDNPDMFSEGRLARLTKLLEELQKPTRQFDRDFWLASQGLLDGILRDIEKARGKLGPRLGEAQTKLAATEARLAEIEVQARAAAAMVEQALFRPEEITPIATPESRAMRTEAERLRSEADTLSQQPDPLNAVRQKMASETDALSKAQEEAKKASDAAAEIERRLAPEEAKWQQARMPEEDMPVFLAELDAAEQLAQRRVATEPLPTEQKAWKQERVAARQAEADTAFGDVRDMYGGGEVVKIGREDFWTSDIWVPLKRVIRDDARLRLFFERLTETKYADKASGRIPKKAEMAPVDYNEGNLVGRYQSLDAEVANYPGGPISPEAWVEELGRRWNVYMDAVDAVNEAKNTPLNSTKRPTVKDAMMAEREARMSEEPWQNPVTGQTEYGIRPVQELRDILEMLRDRDALAAQATKVENLRRERDIAIRKAQEANRAVREIDRRVTALGAEATRLEGESTTLQASRLRAQAADLEKQAQALETRTPQGRLTTTGPSGRTTRLVRTQTTETKPREVVGYEFSKGVAKKLDAAQTVELGNQQKQYETVRSLQEKLDEQDRLRGETAQIGEGAAQYRQSLEAPSGAAILQAAQRPLLTGETAQPTWIPVGEAPGVRPVASLDIGLAGEGVAPETKMSIERQRSSTFIAQTPAEFASRLKEVIGQVGRNRVINNIITDEQITSNAETILGPRKMDELRAKAQQRVESQGIDRTTAEFDSQVKQEFGDLVIRELDYAGFEPVSPVRMPDEANQYAGRAPLGNLTSQVKGADITPTTLVMRKGLRENLAAFYEPKGSSKLPPGVAASLDWVRTKTSQWKSMVLPISLRWQVGDFMGNVINASVRGGIAPGELAKLIIEVDRRLREPGGLTRRQMLFGDTFGQPLADPVLSTLIGMGLKPEGLRTFDIREAHGTKLRPLSGAKKPVSKLLFPGFREKAFIFNEAQNAIVRSAVALQKLEQALMERGRTIDEIDPIAVHNDPVLYEAVRDAVVQANDALGSFSQLSPFEKQTMRSIYPFWSWLKFINKAAADLIVSQPDKVLFYSHLGSLALGDDGKDLYDWLKNQTSVRIPGYGTALIDLSFMNPYTDAILFGRNTAEEVGQTATSVSPIITAGTRGFGELVYHFTGREMPYLNIVARPGYLEGRPGSTTRSLGDTLGGIAYQNFRTFAGPLRFLTEIAPTVRVPGTDVLLGPGPRYQQGSLRTTTARRGALLPPTQQRISALLRGFGVPMPSAELPRAQNIGRQIGRQDIQSLRRRERQRRLSRIGR